MHDQHLNVIYIHSTGDRDISRLVGTAFVSYQMGFVSIIIGKNIELITPMEPTSLFQISTLPSLLLNGSLCMED